VSATAWEHNSKDGLVSATITLDPEHGRDREDVLAHELAHVVIRYLFGPDEPIHGPRHEEVVNLLHHAILSVDTYEPPGPDPQYVSLEWCERFLRIKVAGDSTFTTDPTTKREASD
jgi:hypothetical protein